LQAVVIHWRQNAYNSRCTSTALVFLAWRKRTSQLARLSIAGRSITHSAETRTNLRLPVIWWFTRQRLVWRYLACASSPPLLY
jgi:hypothetical protein